MANGQAPRSARTQGLATASCLSPEQKYSLARAVSQAVSTHSTPPCLFRAIVTTLRQSFDVDRAAMTVYRPERDTFEVSAIETFSSVDLSIGDEFPRKGSYAGRTVRQGKPVVEHDRRRSRRVATEAQLFGRDLGSLVVAPVVSVDGQTIGTLTLGSRTPGCFSTDDLELFDLVGRQVGTALDRMGLEQALATTTAQLRDAQAAMARGDDAFEQLLDDVNTRRQGFRHSVCQQIREAIVPLLDALQRRLERGQLPPLDRCRDRVEVVLSLDLDDSSLPSPELTPRERRVATLIRDGLTSREIANQLHLALVTVNTHRDSIRKKLGIAKQRVGLGTFLQTNRVLASI